MKRSNIFLSILNLQFLLLVACACGCKSSGSHVRYISPRIEGRVLDSQSLQPIKSVEVRRLNPDGSYQSGDQPKGGTVMQQTPAVVHTSANGGFVLPSERDVSVFGGRGWYSVTLALKHPDYESTRKMYDLGNATNAPTGEPLVRAGDILLKRKAK